MSSTMEPEGLGDNLISEDELKGLLDRWIAPQPSKSLDQRVANSYHRETASPDSMLASARFPQSHNEVVKMKFCSTCKEELADKFSFCPVDGTPLNVLVAEPVNNVADSVSVEESTNASIPFSTNEPALPGEPSLTGASSYALVPRGEYHVT